MFEFYKYLLWTVDRSLLTIFLNYSEGSVEN